MKPSGNGQLFEIHASQDVFNAIKELQREESKKGKGQQFLNALRALYDRLRNRSKRLW
jgi:hypothetical protein